MSEQIFIPKGISKNEKYELLVPQIKSLVESESDLIANLANVSAVLKDAFNLFWVGFYLVKDDELVLGPFQGPIACTRIGYGKGVCGSSWKEAKAIIVPDVDKFPGHIACSSLSRSEIVVPLISEDKVVGVLDVDSLSLNDFDTIDERYLSEICSVVSKLF